MKVLLFTHSQDIDGAGCALLAEQAFQIYTLVPTKTFDINKNVQKYIDNKFIYDYDKVFVSDLCIKEPLLKFINEDEELRNKIIVIDHHKSEIDEGNDKYPFVNIIVEQDGIKQSGTSLFYKYLIENNFIRQNELLDKFVELTRTYDTWNGNKDLFLEGRKLHILFESLSFDKYLEIMGDKLDNADDIIFNEYESKIIDRYENNLKQEISNALKDIKIVTLNINNISYKIGYINIEYKYRNDVNGIVKKDNKYDIDAIGMIMKDTDTVSYRQVHDIDVSVIGNYFGGKGHREAASNLKDNEKFKEKVLNNL